MQQHGFKLIPDENSQDPTELLDKNQASFAFSEVDLNNNIAHGDQGIVENIIFEDNHHQSDNDMQ